jgi:leucyl aminopeptidase
MDVTVKPWTVNEAQGDMACVFLLEGGPADMHPLVQQAVENKDISGAADKALLIPAYRTFEAKRMFIAGLGKPDALTTDRVRKGAALAIAKARELKLRILTMVMPDVSLDDDEVIGALVEGALLADYSYSKHTDPQHEKQQHVEMLHIAVAERAIEPLRESARRAQTVCAGVRFVRDLVNENSSFVTTLHMEALARELAARHGLPITVLDEKEIQAQQLNLLYAVGKAGSTPPRLIVVEYNGNPSSPERVALVGKTITFDAGGMNLKPTGSMETMHSDMAGGATVLGLLDVAATLKLPINIVCVLAAAENAIGRDAYHPGEVIKSYLGKTVEVKNTDAEGRLVLADAIAYTIKQRNPSALIDLATLTGAALVALGTHVIPMISNNNDLSRRIFDAGQRTYERVWALPLYDEFKEEIKSEVADIKNLGEGKNAGTIAGAAFLNEFVGSTPWAHLDIAGVAFYEKAKGYLPQGATGVGVRLLVELLSSWEGRVVEAKNDKEVLHH